MSTAEMLDKPKQGCRERGIKAMGRRGERAESPPPSAPYCFQKALQKFFGTSDYHHQVQTHPKATYFTLNQPHLHPNFSWEKKEKPPWEKKNPDFLVFLFFFFSAKL